MIYDLMVIQYFKFEKQVFPQILKPISQSFGTDRRGNSFVFFLEHEFFRLKNERLERVAE